MNACLRLVKLELIWIKQRRQLCSCSKKHFFHGLKIITYMSGIISILDFSKSNMIWTRKKHFLNLKYTIEKQDKTKQSQDVFPTVMTKRRIKINLEFVTIKQFVVPGRMTARAIALHSAKIVGPLGTASVFFQPLFLCSPVKRLRKDLHQYNSKLTIVQIVMSHLFWNQTWTTRMSSPVSCESCSLTCLAGFGLLLYAIFSVSSCFAVIVVLGRLFGWSPSMLPPSASSVKEEKPSCISFSNFVWIFNLPLAFACS